MNKKVIFAFITGAAAGAIGAYVYLNKKFEERFRKEVQSVKESYDYLFDISPEDKAEASKKPDDDKPQKQVIDQVQKDYAEYAKQVEQYTNYNAIRTQPLKPLLKEDKPNIEYISSDDWGMIDEYEECFYTFFTDGIMIEGAIRNEEMITHDPENLIGDKDDFMKHIGEYDEDVLIGVNHQREQYFEVTFVDEKYNEDEED